MGDWSSWLAHRMFSVMATEILGDTIDIHGGGADLGVSTTIPMKLLKQTKTGKTFANYWMHNGFVNVDNEKMSKILQVTLQRFMICLRRSMVLSLLPNNTTVPM